MTELQKILGTAGVAQAMGQMSAAFAKPDAARAVAAAVMGLA
jgi:hypothetical protein